MCGVLHLVKGEGESFVSIGSRLKEERQRLGLSQTDFAALASVSKRSQITWEKDEASPNAAALAALSAAGVDVLYVLSGQRAAEQRADALIDIKERLALIRRTLADPDEEFWDKVRLTKWTNKLQSTLQFDTKLLTPELKQEAEELLQLTQDEEKLRAFRAAEFTDLRARKDQMKRRLAEAFTGLEPRPSETVSYLMLQLAVDYGIPTRALAELWEEIQADISEAR